MALALSAEQQAAIDQIKYPAGWDKPNPSMTPDPYPWYNSYTNPAFLGSYPAPPQFGGGLDLNGKYSDQFTSALTQRAGISSTDTLNQLGSGLHMNYVPKPMYQVQPVLAKGRGKGKRPRRK